LTADSMVIALRATFVAAAAQGPPVSYELRLGEIVLHARVEGGTVTVGEGGLAEPDLVIESGPGLKDLMSGALQPAQAIASGRVHLTGDAALLERFVELFHIPTRPASAA
jgi:putative sterol carrier protein